jgi:hypothetical protein
MMKITKSQLKIIIKEELKPLLEAYDSFGRAGPEAGGSYSAKDRSNRDRLDGALSKDLAEHRSRIEALEHKVELLMGSSGGNTDPQ